MFSVSDLIILILASALFVVCAHRGLTQFFFFPERGLTTNLSEMSTRNYNLISIYGVFIKVWQIPHQHQVKIKGKVIHPEFPPE